MEDYKERYVKEYEELLLRLSNLHAIILKGARGKLPFKLNCPLELLHEQERAMSEYARALIRRSHYENVELNVDAYINIFYLTKGIGNDYNHVRRLAINAIKKIFICKSSI